MSDITSISANQPKLFIEKIEKLEQEKAEVMETIKETFAESKSVGFDTKIMKQIIQDNPSLHGLKMESSLLKMFP